MSSNNNNADIEKLKHVLSMSYKDFYKVDDIIIVRNSLGIVDGGELVLFLSGNFIEDVYDTTIKAIRYNTDMYDWRSMTREHCKRYGKIKIF